MLLAVTWLAFVVRGAFYCVEQPMWEGFDEWAHFAYIQRIGDRGGLPSRTEPVSSVVARSLGLVPMSAAAGDVSPGTITHEAYWKLTPSERQRRQEELRRLSFVSENAGRQFPARQYEAQHPPLYHVLLTPAYLLTKGQSLPAQVVVLRLLSMAIASGIVLLAYRTALYVLRRRTLAILVAVLVACFPGLFIDVCRIGNDSLAIVLVSAVVLMSLHMRRRPFRVSGWLILGVLVGAAALTKAYALALLPLLPLLAGFEIANTPARWKRTLAGFGLACILVLAIAGWWYWRTWAITGTLSGEQLGAAASRITVAEKFSAASGMNWLRVADAAAFTHIWIGGWSFLVVRSWMYRVFELIAAAGAIGLGVHMLRTIRHSRWSASQDLLILLLAFATMCSALAYHSLVIFMMKGISTGIGWYLYAVIVPEAVLLAVGLRNQWALASTCLLAGALDLYTMNLKLMPHHTGMAPVDGIGSLLERLSVNKPGGLGPNVLAATWVTYLCSTACLIAIAFVVAFRARKARVRVRADGRRLTLNSSRRAFGKWG